MSDFPKDHERVNHHTCDCMRRKADAYDHLHSQLLEEIERLRSEADEVRGDGDKLVEEADCEFGRGERLLRDAETQYGRAGGLSDVANCLSDLLSELGKYEPMNKER